MNTSFPSFLSENANRAYPFAEDSTFRIPTNSTDIPDNDIFLDFRGWSRLKLAPSTTFFLVDVVYDLSMHSSYPGLESFGQEESMSIFFKAFFTTDTEDLASQVMCFYVPLAMNSSQFPYTSTASALMPNGKKAWEAKIVVTEKVYDLVSTGHLLTDDEKNLTTDTGGKIIIREMYTIEGDGISPAIEPGQFFEIGGTAIDQLNIIFPLSPEKNRYLSGDVKFLPGVNTAILQSNDTIIANSNVGFGTGKQVYTGTDLGDPCDGIIKINGTAPDEYGQFYITGEHGILVENVPSENTIKISINKTDGAFKCIPTL